MLSTRFACAFLLMAALAAVALPHAAAGLLPTPCQIQTLLGTHGRRLRQFPGGEAIIVGCAGEA